MGTTNVNASTTKIIFFIVFLLESNGYIGFARRMPTDPYAKQRFLPYRSGTLDNDFFAQAGLSLLFVFAPSFPIYYIEKLLIFEVSQCNIKMPPH
jgi:hypothetical protein